MCKITNLVKIWAQYWSSKLYENNDRKKPTHSRVAKNYMLSDAREMLLVRLKFWGEKLPISLKIHYLGGGSFLTMFSLSTVFPVLFTIDLGQVSMSLPSKLQWS